MPTFFAKSKRKEGLIALATFLVDVYGTHDVLKIHGEEIDEIVQLKNIDPQKFDLDRIEAICKYIVKLVTNQKNLEMENDTTLNKILKIPDASNSYYSFMINKSRYRMILLGYNNR